jgi:hypothetical protein
MSGKVVTVAEKLAAAGAVTVQLDPITCKTCGETDLPTLCLLADGTGGPCCARCGADQGISTIGGRPCGLTEDKKSMVPQREVTPLAHRAPSIVTPSPRKPPAGRPPLRVVPAAAVPVTDEWADNYGEPMSPEDVIDHRLVAARIELARLKVDQCRMHGLEAEVKSLEKARAKFTRDRQTLT